MTIVVVDQGEEHMLDRILGVDYTLRLYRNDVTAGLTDAEIDALTESDFTQANFTGFAVKILTAANWVTTSATVDGDPAVGTYATQTFTRTSTGTAQTIYGYHVTRNSDLKLMWFEQFPGPITMTNAGDSIEITPTITLDDDKDATVTARGIIAKQELATTAPDQSADGATDFALSDVEVSSARTYVVHLDMPWTITATGRWICEFQVDGSTVGRLWDETAPSGQLSGYTSGECLWEPDSGTYDLTVYADEVSGSSALRLIGSAGAPRKFWVEDVGPRVT